MKYPKDISGMKIGKLTVIETCDYIAHNGKKLSGVKCQCDCGNIKIVRRNDFLSGKSKSCGCLIKEFNSKRGIYTKESRTSLAERLNAQQSDVTKILNSYKSMKYRCYNPNSINYKNYGGRGIKICDEWLTNRSSFVEWALSNGYEQGLTIDRIDNNGDYCPENCKWSTKSEQSRNMRSNTIIFYNGERYILTDLAKKLHMDEKTLRPIAKRNLELKGDI